MPLNKEIRSNHSNIVYNGDSMIYIFGDTLNITVIYVSNGMGNPGSNPV